MPFRTAFPDSGSISEVSARTLLLTPACPGRLEPDPRRVVAPAVRDRDDAGADRVGDLDGCLDRAGSDVSRARSPSIRPRRSASSGLTCIVQRSLPFTSAAQVVHPGVVRAQLPAADQDEVPVARALERRAQAGRRRRRAAPARARSSPDGVRRTSGMRGSSGPRSTPWGLRSSSSSVRPYGPASEGRGRVRGPVRGDRRAPRATSAGSRPREWGLRVGDRPLDERVDHERVERVEVRVRTLAGHDRRET